ncbi:MULTISPECIES: phage major capsid protein [unclassified Rhodococcus (in: high G+C Gram-positive bacteria)]|uniref:phage major capsid protein n=1 Tax=unclassified Rhodococcus (in: high G+C Gram-positive bacteria) TaxID=192944 RepID=UPI001AE5B03D|nr:MULTISPECIES: phage major capsid protein [unclassified Rhodococcus (in: high G+C Gram-positive bacteria)]MBP2523567.1 HK97 family phage major capsid protein [Rhodococcus sp. PvP104]MDA3634752.1 phage major capsid protein [Rhodococcus sp. C-2]
MKIDVKDKRFDHLRGLSNEQRAAKLSEHLAYVEPLTTRSDGLNAEESERLATALDELEFLGHLKEQRERLLSLHDSGSRENGTTFETTSTHRDSDPTKDLALRNAEAGHKAGHLTDKGAAAVEHMVRTDSTSARWAAVTGTPEYRSAFGKLLSNPSRGHLLWTPEESRAYSDVENIRSMIGGSGGTGKFIVPFDLDPAILLTNAGSASPIREIARVVQTASDSWNGVTSAGVSAEWLAEEAEAADASPVLAPKPIPVHKGAAFVPFSYELEQDGVDLLGQLQALLFDAALQQQNTAFVTGNGTTQPKGFVTALVAAGGAAIQTGTGSEALASGDPYKLQNALGARFQANARFGANLSILNELRQAETGSGALKFPGLHNVPATLLGRPAHEISGMDGVLNAAATEANYSLVYADWSNYVVVDRIGSTIELIQNLFGTSNRPTGQRGVLLHYRVGADVVNPNAFKLLNVATTA